MKILEVITTISIVILLPSHKNQQFQKSFTSNNINFRNNLGYIKSRFKRKRKPIPEKQRQRWMAFASFCCTEAC